MPHIRCVVTRQEFLECLKLSLINIKRVDEKNTHLECALGFAIVIILILLSIVLEARSVPNISVIADFCVAAGTIALAFVTYMSVRTSEENAALARDALDLQRLSFSKEQAIDQIKTVFDRVVPEIENELKILNQNAIDCVSIHYSLSLTNYKRQPINFKPTEPAVLSINQSYPDFLLKLNERNSIFSELDSTVNSFFNELDESEEKITQLIRKQVVPKYVPETYEDENGQIFYFGEREVICLGELHQNEYPISVFRKLMIAMLIYDRWVPIEPTNLSFTSDDIRDAARDFLKIKNDLNEIVSNERLDKIKTVINAHLKELCEVDKQTKDFATTVKSGYILKYSLTTADLKSNDSP